MLRSVSLPPSISLGRLYLSAMPGRYQPLAEFFDEIRSARVNHIVCLVSDAEIEKKSPSYLAAIRNGSIPALLKRLPISDYGIPDQVDEITSELDRLHCLIGSGESVVIHCAGGHGRTGMIATMLLLRVGLPLGEAAAIIHQAGAAPDTPAQQEFLEHYSLTQLPPEDLPDDE